MRDAGALQPTLWRTCRVLANRLRLKMLGAIVRRPGQTVSAVAKQFHVRVGVASEYLRALEARSLLIARRNGRWVQYEPANGESEEPRHRLGAAVSAELKKGGKVAEKVFRLATAFTHPRRIEVYRALRGGPATLSELKQATRIAERALLRHLEKLNARGFVVPQGKRPRRYALGKNLGHLGSMLADEANRK
jgi:DNA-binding transcriptional ArsR family regulator